MFSFKPEILPDIIQILPDAVANRIAAGEVVQRPASAVKELLENSIDAGSTHIRLLIKEGGKTLIQVSDNGKGMSETDARMSFERHATSKIKDSEDLFKITTKGFRGEALASIAAVSKSELKTKTEGSTTGTRILVESSECVLQEPCAMNNGTLFSIKNLFYNVPARRKFLKSDPVETKHIIDEFTRVALAHPNIAFDFVNNEHVLYKLESGTLRQRIVGLLGNSYNDKLVPVSEQTDIINVEGFVVKPEFSKKTRGDQFFFVNNRFIRSSFLNHAVEAAFEGLMSKDGHPGYFIFMESDPAEIDINIHPSKTEIKFTEERSIYQILRSSIKQALGKYNISPSLDFERETIFDFPAEKDFSKIKIPSISVNSNYNPFEEETKFKSNSNLPSPPQKSEQEINNLKNWDTLYKEFDDFTVANVKLEIPEEISSKKEDLGIELDHKSPIFINLFQNYIVTALKSGLVVIHRHRAHERIIYERLEPSFRNGKSMTQQLLFPQTFELSAPDFEILKEILEELQTLGFDIDLFGKNTLVIRGIPADLKDDSGLSEILEALIDQFKIGVKNLNLDKREILLRSLADKMAIKHNFILEDKETDTLIANLFACKNPSVSPSGKPILLTISEDELNQKFVR